MNNFNGMVNNTQRNSFPSYFNPVSNNNATNNIIWVQGIEGAKAWQLAPNSMVVLLDSEAEGKMYIKVTDNIGMANLRIFSYVEETVQPAQGNTTTNNSLDLSEYVKKDELSTLIKELINNEQFVSTVESATTADSTKRVITVPKK
jgi:hypothetical protein